MTQTVGNQESARAALKGELTLLSAFGCSRMVYREGDTVYKVERGTFKGANYREHRRARAYRNCMPADIVIPDMSLYDIDGTFVLAMPYIDGTFPNVLPARVHNDIFSVSEDATVWGNVVSHDGTYYIIDLDY